MALDFPSNPVNGQIYNNFYYDSSTSAWRSIGSVYAPNYLKNPVFSTTSATGVPVTTQGVVGQTANLEEWKNSSGTVLANIDATGMLNNTSIGTTNLYLNRQDMSNEGGQINFRRSTDNADFWYIDVYGNTSTPSLRFFNASASMQIDGSGRLTTPQQPHFRVNMTGSGQWSQSAGGYVKFNNASSNIGSGYNSSTGLFTAPVAGTYVFTTTFFMHTSYGNSTDSYWGIYKNGSPLLTTNHGYQGYDGGQSASVIMQMSAGDTAGVYVISGAIVSYVGEYNSFSGFMVG